MDKTKKKPTLGELLRRQGFDLTEYSREERTYYVGCSQCVVMTVNGIPVHEEGCPNEKGEICRDQ